jgi:hypothetical protein
MNYKTTASSIIITLPITMPTGKVWVKRPVQGFASNPVACRSEPINPEDYLEWQISYDTENLHEPSVVKKVVLRKPTGVRYGCELVRLLHDGRKISLITPEEVAKLREIVNNPDMVGIEETEQIAQKIAEPPPSAVIGDTGFKRYQLLVPNYIKEGNQYNVEIKIAHKQKAVGNQAMIFLNLPIAHCSSKSEGPLVGRAAEKLEQVDYTINSENRNLIYDTALAFAIASQRHRRDLAEILSKLAKLGV